MANVADSEQCTLNEVNEEVRRVFFSLMKYLDPSSWKDSDQVVSTMTDSWEAAVRSYQTRNVARSNEGSPQVKYPFGTVTRVPEFEEIEVTTINRPWRVDYYNKENLDSSTTSVSTIDVMGIRLGYICKMYDRRYDRTEFLLDRILVDIAKQGQVFTYNSETLGVESYFHVTFSYPFPFEVPEVTDREDGKGEVIGLQIDLQVDAILGTKKESKIILTSFVDIYLDKETFDTRDEPNVDPNLTLQFPE